MKKETFLILILSLLVAGISSGTSGCYITRSVEAKGSFETPGPERTSRSEARFSLSRLAPTYENGKFSFQALSVLESGEIWSVGYDGVNPGLIRHSTNEGAGWVSKPIASEFVMPHAITFTDSLNGWVVGLNNVFNTTDGGKNWNSTRLKTEADFESVSFFNSKIGFIAGAVNIEGRTAVEIWMTKDGAKTWTQSFRDPQTRHPYALIAVSENVALAVLDATSFFRTDDGGKTWNKFDMFDEKGTSWDKVKSLDYDITDFALDQNNKLWAVGRDGVFYFSIDNGTSWNRPQRLPDEAKLTSWSSIRFFDNKLGIAVGQNGAIIATSDGGDSWKKIGLNKVDPDEDLYQIQGNDNFGIIIGSDYVYKIEFH